MTTHELIFNGYWIGKYISEITNASGILLVYKCECDYYCQEVQLRDLLYIGKATNLNEAANDVIKNSRFKNQCHKNETLCFSYAEVAEKDLDIVENALIFAQKPMLNTNLKDSFNHDVPVAFKLEGRCSLMRYRKFKIEKK